MDFSRLRRIYVESTDAGRDRKPPAELIAVGEIEKAFISYRHMRILQYIRQDTGEVLAHVYDGADRSPAHESLIGKLENQEEGLRVLRAEKKPDSVAEQLDDPLNEILDLETIEETKWKSQVLNDLRRAIREYEDELVEQQKQGAVVRNGDFESRAVELEEEIKSLRTKLEELESTPPRTEILSMVEHRPRLMEAFREASHFILIVSPWLSPVAVNHEMLEAISSALEKGVTVIIGFGFDKENSPQEKEVLRNLRRISKNYEENLLKVVRLKESHAKVVICDNQYLITTSFNWLSFAGRSDWGNRVEFGMLSREKSSINDMKKKVEALFEDGEIII